MRIADQGIGRKVRMDVWNRCRIGKRVQTGDFIHPQTRVRSAFYTLARQQLIEIDLAPCKNPLGYRLVAKIHQRLKHLLQPITGKEMQNAK